MNIWEIIILFNKAYWWVWVAFILAGIFTLITENCPAAGKLIHRAIEKICHVDFNMDDEF